MYYTNNGSIGSLFSSKPSRIIGPIICAALLIFSQFSVEVPQARASGNKPKTLHILYANAAADVSALKSLVPKFKKKFGIKLDIDTAPYDALQQRVFSEFASHSSHYDLVIVDTPWVPALLARLQPLGKYLNDPKINEIANVNLSDFIPKVFYDTTVYKQSHPSLHFPNTSEKPNYSDIYDAGFQIYGLPIQANALVMAYRKDLFSNPKEQALYKKKTGRALAVPDTWPEYTSVAEFFTRPDKGLYGTTAMAGVGDWATDDFKTLLAGWGGNGHLIGDDHSVDFNTAQGRKALQYYANLINKYKVVPPGSTSASWNQAASYFDSGKTAMTMNYNRLQLNKNVRGTIRYATILHGPKGFGPHFGTWMLSINKYSNHKKWAYRALIWLTSAKQQLAMTKYELHPTRTSVYREIKASRRISPKLKSFYKALSKTLPYGVGRPRLTNYTQVSHAIATAVNNAATQSVTPRVALQHAASNVHRLLKQAGYKVPSK